MLLAGLLDPATQMPRSRLFWAALGALIAAQLVAFWMLCSGQVEQAQTRHARVQVNQLALADCLQYIPGATVASCNGRGDYGGHPENTLAAGTVPVNLTIR